MINKLFHKIWKQEGQEVLSTPKNLDAIFMLFYKELHIGTLSLKNEIWSFRYSEVFKQQEKLVPLPDFPNLDKTYASKELYPFFVSRIPGLGQPKVKQILKEESIDEANEVELLKRFGKKSIANPFLLLAG